MDRDLVTEIGDLGPMIDSLASGMVKRVQRRGVPEEDLRQSGWLAAVEYAGRYQGRAGASLATYLYPRIRGAMQDHIRCWDWASRSVRRKGRLAYMARCRLEQRLGRSVSRAEARSESGLEIEEYHALLADLNMARLEVFEDCVDEAQPSPEDLAEAAELHQRVQERMKRLGMRDQQILRWSYSDAEKTLNFIARSMGLSEGRVCQLRQAALRDLMEEVGQ